MLLLTWLCRSVVVVLQSKIYVYNFADLKLVDHIETISNPKGNALLVELHVVFLSVLTGHAARRTLRPVPKLVEYCSRLPGRQSWHRARGGTAQIYSLCMRLTQSADTAAPSLSCMTSAKRRWSPRMRRT